MRFPIYNIDLRCSDVPYQLISYLTAQYLGVGWGIGLRAANLHAQPICAPSRSACTADLICMHSQTMCTAYFAQLE